MQPKSPRDFKKQSLSKGPQVDFLVSLFGDARYLYLLAGAVFLAGLGCLLWFLFLYATSSRTIHATQIPETATTTLAVTEDCPARRLLDGVCVPVGSESPALVGIMVENSYDAWPLSGISAASVVYEAPVEGNIPRFLAIYPITTSVAKVGPVRSARWYYIDWLSEYGPALYFHVGGSPQAMERLAGVHDFTNVDEFFHAQLLWRASDRHAPHNTYTETSRWQSALTLFDVPTSSQIQAWHFTDSTSTCSDNCVTSITVSFLSPTYDAEWRYVSSTARYTRYQNYRPDVDEDGTPIVADTIIVDRTDVSVMDDVGRKELRTIGTGEALVFYNGNLMHGTWKKPTVSARTRWYDTTGAEILLKPGKIWIETVGPGQNNVHWE